MKKLIFLFLALPIFAAGQNFLYQLTPTNGEFDVWSWDDSRESYPRPGDYWGLKDTAELQLFAYQRIEQDRNKQATEAIQALILDLSAEQTHAAIMAVIPLDYQTWINNRLVGVFDGAYQYVERGTATNLAVVIDGGDLKRQSDNVVLATLSARANNWIRATLTSGGEVVNLYQFGTTWVGKRANGNFVTMKKN